MIPENTTPKRARRERALERLSVALTLARSGPEQFRHYEPADIERMESEERTLKERVGYTG